MSRLQLEYFNNNEGIVSQKGAALTYRLYHELIQIEAWGKDSLRVRITQADKIRDDLPGALLSHEETGFKPATDAISITETGGSIRNGNIEARVTKKEGKLVFWDLKNNRELVREAQPHIWINGRVIRPLTGDSYKIEANFQAYDDEKFYGLGQHHHGKLNQKGCVIDLCQRNAHVTIPFLVSSRGYGFLWNNPAVGRVELGMGLTRWVADVAPQMDYWITAGDSVSDIMSNYVDATGHAPPLPYYASGFWQCRLRYKSQEEVLTVAREYKKRGLPLDIIVIDYFHWSHHGDWKFDSKFFPDPKAMVDELKEMNVEVMVSIWPTLQPDSENFEEMERRGLLLRNSRGPNVHHRFYDNPTLVEAKYITHYDATNPEGREFIWSKVKKNYHDLGIKIWWLDADEPEVEPVQPEMLRFHIGDGAAVYNISPMLHGMGFYKGMKEAGHEDGDIISLSRSGWAGSQRWGQAIWSGDITSTFETLAGQVRAGLNMGLSGIPWWTTDIGGFVEGNIYDETFRELIVRWFQYGAFCPLFRLHGFRDPMPEPQMGAANEVWVYGDEAYKILSNFLHIRERLRPYVMKQMDKAAKDGTPPMRPLFYDFESDAKSWDIEDEFLFGPSILVAPILKYKARSREVYLPAGAKWTNAWTDEVVDGGQTITVDAPLETLPLFLRDDAKLPIKA
ncbi:family 31 glycosyl hydrolase [Fennellomyces sp. T-0311]|nr:family 31 glycosyl hydrolase [Fennellomyces sp. T-0311]